MLNKDFIRRKVSLIEDELTRLTEFENLTLNDTASDFRTRAIVERLLERVIGRALDVNQHIIAEKGAHLKSVTKYRETFLRLAELGVYSQEFAERIAPSAGFRNALVHDYNDIDPRILQKSIGEAIREYNEYGKHVLAFLEKEKNGFGLVKIVIGIAAAILIGGYFLFFFRMCEETAPPKLGQYDSSIVERDDGYVICRTIFNRISDSWGGWPSGPITPTPAEPPRTDDTAIDTSTWKTYRNEQYGFTVQYPPDWFLRSESFDTLLLDVSSVPRDQFVHGLGVPGRGGLQMRVIQGTVPACRSISGDFDTDTDTPGLRPYEKIICNGDFTLILIYTDHYRDPLSRAEVEKARGTLEAIASTFLDTYRWKTYRNEKYGFEVRYPPELTVTERNGPTWAVVMLKGDGLDLAYFAGMREVGGPGEGHTYLWSKKVIIAGKEVEETLSQSPDGTIVLLQIGSPLADYETRYDSFSAFFKSVEDANQKLIFIEAFARSLRLLR